MITEKQLIEMERRLKNQDEYDSLAWGSKFDIKLLIKEVRRLSAEVQDSLHKEKK
jgi:hypothetical protein